MAGEQPTLLQTLRAAGEVACCDLALAGDGAWLASGGGGGQTALRLWRWAPGAGWAPAGEAPRAHRYGVTALRWAGSGAVLASGGVDGAVRVWARAGTAEAPAPRGTLAAPGAAAVRALCWLGRGVLCCGHDDGALAVWRAAGGQLARLHAHDGALHALAAPARGALLLSACTEGVLKVFNVYGRWLLIRVGCTRFAFVHFSKLDAPVSGRSRVAPPPCPRRTISVRKFGSFLRFD